MKVITESAEHCFLNFLDKLNKNPSGWVAFTFPFSKKLQHDVVMRGRQAIQGELKRSDLEATAFLEKMQPACVGFTNLVTYRFADNDILLMCRPKDEAEQKKVKEAFQKLSKNDSDCVGSYGHLTKDLYIFQKLADHKLLSAKKIEAYKALAEQDVVASLPLRRHKREHPLVLVVEDDRFSSSYITGFLKDYDVVVARTGEEAILKYIEEAPDAVFLDVHLPGLNGHQVLQAIKGIDQEAFVVMLSVDTVQSSIMAASRNGAISYLKKPFSRERVLNTLRLSPFIRDSIGVLPYSVTQTSGRL